MVYSFWGSGFLGFRVMPFGDCRGLGLQRLDFLGFGLGGFLGLSLFQCFKGQGCYGLGLLGFRAVRG